MYVPPQTGEETVGVRRVLDHCCMPQLSLIQISAFERCGLMRMLAWFLLGKQKAVLQLADISIVTLHWQNRQHQ